MRAPCRTRRTRRRSPQRRAGARAVPAGSERRRTTPRQARPPAPAIRRPRRSPARNLRGPRSCRVRSCSRASARRLRAGAPRAGSRHRGSRFVARAAPVASLRGRCLVARGARTVARTRALPPRRRPDRGAHGCGRGAAGAQAGRGRAGRASPPCRLLALRGRPCGGCTAPLPPQRARGLPAINRSGRERGRESGFAARLRERARRRRAGPHRHPRERERRRGGRPLPLPGRAWRGGSGCSSRRYPRWQERAGPAEHPVGTRGRNPDTEPGPGTCAPHKRRRPRCRCPRAARIGPRGAQGLRRRVRRHRQPRLRLRFEERCSARLDSSLSRTRSHLDGAARSSLVALGAVAHPGRMIAVPPWTSR